MKLRYEPYKFSNPAAARDFAYRCIKAHRLFLGDDNKVWVVCMADGEKLLRGGYEEIK